MNNATKASQMPPLVSVPLHPMVCGGWVCEVWQSAMQTGQDRNTHAS